MTRYLEVFFRYKIALASLMFVSLIVSTAVVMIMPRNYQSTATLWFDFNPIPDDSALAAAMTPADQATAAFHEMLNTRDFDIKVGHRGPLAEYYETTGNFPKSDPVTPIVHWIERKPEPTGATRAALVDNGIVLTLQKYILITPTQPRVVGLAFDFSDPEVATGTLQAFIDQFSEQVKSSSLVSARSTLEFYTAQANAQKLVVEEKQKAQTAYYVAHPILQNPQAQATDPTYISLVQTTQSAEQDYIALLRKVDQSKLDVARLLQPGPYGFRIVDSPQRPIGSNGLLKSVMFGVGGGLGVGLLIIGVICFLLVAADDSIVRGSDLQRRLGARVIGEVPLLPTRQERADAPTRKVLPTKVL